MKFFRCCLVAAIFLPLSGCWIIPEKIENHVRYIDNTSPPQITVIWHNISSDADTDEELKKDFDSFIDHLKSDTHQGIFLGSKKEVLIQKWEMYVENGKLQLKVFATLADKFEDIASHDERMLVLDNEFTGKIETNGRLLQTERNYIIVWPETANELFWSNQIYPNAFVENDQEDLEKLERNRAKLLKLFEAYKAGGKL